MSRYILSPNARAHNPFSHGFLVFLSRKHDRMSERNMTECPNRRRRAGNLHARGYAGDPERWPEGCVEVWIAGLARIFSRLATVSTNRGFFALSRQVVTGCC